MESWKFFPTKKRPESTKEEWNRSKKSRKSRVKECLSKDVGLSVQFWRRMSHSVTETER